MIGLILPQFRNLFWIKGKTSYIFRKVLLVQSELRKNGGGRSNLIRIFNEINRAALFYNIENKEKIRFGKEALDWADWMLLGSKGHKEDQ